MSDSFGTPQTSDLDSNPVLNGASLNSSSVMIQKLCEMESQELRTTVSRLERLLELEREERNSNEAKALQLLTDVKRQWQEREEIRIHKMRSEVESANAELHESQKKNNKLTNELTKALNELESVLEVKAGLKAKCIEFKRKLETLSENFKEKCKKLQEVERELSKLDSERHNVDLKAKEIKTELKNRQSLFDFEKTELQTKLRDLEQQCERSDAKLKVCEDQISKVVEREKETNKSLLEKQQQNDCLEHKLEEVNQELNEKKTKLEFIESLVTTLKEEKVSLDRNFKLQMEKNERIKDEWRKKVEEIEKDGDKEMEKLKNENEELQNRIAILENEKTEEKSKCDEWGKAHSGLQRQIIEIQDQKEKSERQLIRKEQNEAMQLMEIERLKEIIQDLKSRPAHSPVKVVTNVVVENDKKKIEMDKKWIEDERAKIDVEVNELKENKIKLERKEEELNSKREKLEKDQNVFRETVSKGRQGLEECKDKLAKDKERFNQEKQRLEAEREELSAERKALEDKMAEKDEDENHKRILQDVERDLGLVKVDLRIAERQVKEQKETIAYLRQMYREERDSTRKMELSNADLQSEVETLKSKISNLEIQEAEQTELTSKLQKVKDDLSQKISDNKILKSKLCKTESDLERVSSLLERAEKEVIKYRDSQSQLNIYKAACLELEDQAKDYENVIEKLETSKVKLNSEVADMRKKIEELESNNTKLKIEMNEIKSMEAFTSSQLKEAEAKTKEMEMVFNEEESKLRDRLKELMTSKEEQTSTIHDFKTQLEDLVTKYSSLSNEETSQRVSLQKLKESYATLLTQYHDLKDRNLNLETQLAKSMESTRSLEVERTRTTQNFERIELELTTKVNQLEKLIDYLQTKLNRLDKRHKNKGIFGLKQESEHVVLPYEVLKDKLKVEENKNRVLLKDLNHVRGELRSTRVKDPILLSTPNDQRANHSIPHRWSNQTNMKVTKCAVCYGHIHFCHQASVCQYCQRTVHVSCVENSPDDCGLPKTLLPVLMKNKKEKPFEGYLKIPEQGGKYWKPVHVSIVKDKMILKDEMTTHEIDLMPSNGGFVFIQSSVGYTELVHTTAYDQPHIFKIGYSASKDTHYFMAKSFSDKALWIKEIENVTLRMRDDEDAEGEEEEDLNSTVNSDLIQGQVAKLSPSTNVYCVATMEGSRRLLGTSEGFLLVNSGSVNRVRGSSSAVFQMEMIPSIDKLLFITGHDRKLALLDMVEIRENEEIEPRIIESVRSCHLFSTGIVNDEIFLCAVDDCRVSLFKYEDDKFRMVHKFSTDKPTSCLRFTATSVLVITDKIYDIDLEDFTVEEFLDLDESPITLSNNYPIAMFKISDNEFLLCFQDTGIFVNSGGTKSRPDMKWNSISGQFAYSNGRLWVTYYNSVEMIDLNEDQRSRMMLCKNPQILSCQDYVFLLEEKNDGLSLLELS